MDTTPRCQRTFIGCGLGQLAVLLSCSTVFGARVYASDAVERRIGAEAWQAAWAAWLRCAIPLVLMRLPCAATALRPAINGSCRPVPCTSPSRSIRSPCRKLPPSALCLPLTAAVVSDAAAGGQVLLCGATFQSVSPMGKELGCVDENGLNFSKLGSWWRSW